MLLLLIDDSAKLMKTGNYDTSQSWIIDTRGHSEMTDMGGDHDIVSTDMGPGVDFETQTKVQIQEVVASLHHIQNMDSETWQQLDDAERLKTLQDIENRIAVIQGRQAVSVQVMPLPPGVYGGYAHGEGITLSQEHFESGDVRELVTSIVHEGRHAYQDHAVHTPGFVIDENLVETWRSNWENYLTAEEYGQELYEMQPIEKDAEQYATRITDALFGPKA